MKVAVRVMLAGACALSMGAWADEDADMQVVAEAVGEMVTAESMLSAAVDGECGKYAPEDIRLTRVAMRQKIEDVEGAMPPGSRKKVLEQIASDDYQNQLKMFRKRGVEDTLAMIRGKGTDPVFACGYLFGFLSTPVLRFDHALARAAKLLSK